MYTITSLDALRARLGVSAGADDARLLAALQAASAQIERRAGRRFCPYVAALAHDIGPWRHGELLLRGDLLALHTLTNGDGTLIPNDDVLLLPGGGGPAGVLLLTNGHVFTWTESPQRAVTVSGVWGWHDNWAQAWIDTGDTVRDATLAAGTTALTVSDATGTDSGGESPRFQVGHLLKIGDEYLRVLAVTVNVESDDVLTVERGAQGTAAAVHTQGDAIARYVPPADVAALVLRWAAYLYREPDQRTATGIPPALVKDLAALHRV